MTANNCGVAVIGGGPAGCAAAVALARAGVEATLYEARTYPHDKVCGEFLSPECVPLLERLGSGDLLMRLGAVPITAACLSAADGTAWEARFPAAGWGISRRTLDAALAEQAGLAGATVSPGTTVTAVSGNLTDGFALTVERPEGRRQVRARAVIAAHGKRATLDRTLGRRFLAGRQPYLALKAHFRGPAQPGQIHLHAFAGGYCGYSEIEGGLFDVCLLVREDTFRRATAGSRDRTATFIAWMQEQNPRLNLWLSQATCVDERWLSIAQVPFQAKEPVLGDLLLAGDAAGLIVPLAGDGIGMALRSGVMAAGHVGAFLEGRLRPNGVAPAYARAWRQRFGSRLVLGRLLQPLWLQPRLAGPGLRLLNLAPGLGRALVAATRETHLTPGFFEGMT